MPDPKGDGGDGDPGGCVSGFVGAFVAGPRTRHTRHPYAWTTLYALGCVAWLAVFLDAADDIGEGDPGTDVANVASTVAAVLWFIWCWRSAGRIERASPGHVRTWRLPTIGDAASFAWWAGVYGVYVLLLAAGWAWWSACLLTAALAFLSLLVITLAKVAAARRRRGY